ncbi:MAG: nitroreductase family protein [Bacteroides sp.]|nr:nitroreductase family protein [Eubacterium sp.]MCM1419188.1 nitroreductase family protein [Roseburia sp.]MCM1463045.1 nitroreductase family protein [Bacteroides sp.]
MDFMKLAADRYSVRSFSDRPVEREKLDRIIRAGMIAPTACNRQPQRILVIEGDEDIEKLRRCTECHFNAPAAMLICYNRDECWIRDYDKKSSGEIDASIVATHMMLEAAALGVGTTWVMHFIPEAVRCEFELPANIEPIALLIMGLPARDSEPSPLHERSKPLGELVAYHKF